MTKRTAKLTGGNKIYIPGLNGVRAIAALIVLFSHIDEYSYRFGLPAIGLFEKGMAGYGVTIFFTLSGFLITYLLLIEKKGGISIKRFYVRRILRIWPLYYLVIIIGILLLLFLPQVKAQGNPIYGLAMFVCFLPNLAYTLGMTLTTITPLWSVGVEEQFYLIWPWLVKKSDNILKASLGVIIVYFIVKLIARYTGNSLFYLFIWNTRIDCMAIGSIGAYLIFEDNRKVMNIVFNKVFEIAAWLILLYSLVFGSIHVFTLIDHELYSLVFLIIILNVGFNKKVTISLENPILNYIGKISYGLYVYHMTVILLFSLVYKKYSLSNTVNTAWLYFFVVATTFLIAHLSYRYFESYFLRLKSKYTVIESANEPDLPYNDHITEQIGRIVN